MKIKLPSKIFIDGGDPVETAQAVKLLGYIDGQTTNPSLVAKNPEVEKFIASGKRFQKDELLKEYKKIVQSVARVTKGPCSIEVYANENSTSEDLLIQAADMYTWIPNAYIKFPIIKAGLEAAGKAVAERIRVNMTLCFSQEQAAAVYSATRLNKSSPLPGYYEEKSPVFISPFVGRLDDIGQNGMEVVVNILEMYKREGDRHVEVLTASVRNIEHLLYALKLKSPAITVPFKVFQVWADLGFKLPAENYIYDPDLSRQTPLEEITYREMSLDYDFAEYNISHDLTTKGLTKFASDWNGLMK